MSQLVPCPACERHVRLPSASCPFCDAALDASSLEARYASRRGGSAPAGAKRAVVFALGTTIAAACTQAQPAYGAVVVPYDPDAATMTGEATSSVTEGNAQPLYGAPVDTTGDTTTENGDTTFVAIYGGPVAPQDAGTSDTLVVSDAATNDAAVPDAAATDPVDAASSTGTPADASSSDAAPADAAVDTDDPIAQPLYGAPAFLDGAVFDPGPVVVPLYGAPPSEQ